MKFHFISTLCLLLSQSLFSSSQDTIITKDLQWLKNLPPAIQYCFYEKNQFRIVKENDISLLMPLKKINLRIFPDVVDLNFLKDFKEVEELLLGPSIKDASILTNDEFGNISKLDISFTYIDDRLLNEMKLPKLKRLVLTGSNVRRVDFIKIFPYLSEIEVLPNQFSKKQLNEIMETNPGISIIFPNDLTFNSLESIEMSIDKYINYFAANYGVASSLPKKFKVQITISKNGNVKDVTIISRKKKTDKLFEELLTRMILIPNHDSVEQVFIIPIKIES